MVTKNLVPGEAVYGEKRISVEGPDGLKTEYRVWNPFRSKLAAGILGGIDNVYIAPGKKVLYLGAASGTTVSHVADIVGPVSIISRLIHMANQGPTGHAQSMFTYAYHSYCFYHRKVSCTPSNSPTVPVVT